MRRSLIRTGYMQQRTNADDAKPEFWSEAASARWASLAPVTLKLWRLKGMPIAPVYKFGRRVMYRAADVRTWAESKRQAPVTAKGA